MTASDNCSNVNYFYRIRQLFDCGEMIAHSYMLVCNLYVLAISIWKDCIN